MNLEDIKSLSEKTREDGKRLFGVSDFIWKVALVGIWFVAIVGGIMSAVIMAKFTFWGGLGIALITAMICFINYIIAVMTTHIAKVMVHTSFSAVGLLEHISKNENKG